MSHLRVQIRSGHHGGTSLYHAAKQGLKKSVFLLLSHGGGRADNFHTSCEKVAVKGVLDLMTRYKVTVEDVTSLLWAELERCASFYRFIRLDLEKVATMEGPLQVQRPPKAAVLPPTSSNHVVVDFMSIVQAIFGRMKVRAFSVEAIEEGRNRFTSWITFCLPKKHVGLKCIFGDCCPSLVKAKGSLAKKIIAYL